MKNKHEEDGDVILDIHPKEKRNDIRDKHSVDRHAARISIQLHQD